MGDQNNVSDLISNLYYLFKRMHAPDDSVNFQIHTLCIYKSDWQCQGLVISDVTEPMMQLWN